MLIERSSYYYGIHILVREQLTIVGICFRTGEHRQPLFKIRLVDIAERHHFRVGYLLQIGKMQLASRTGAYEADADLARRLGLLLVRSTGSDDRKSREGYACGTYLTNFSKKRSTIPKLLYILQMISL